jgi:multisubunit Na+/H+ antiporter MnhB subunit
MSNEGPTKNDRWLRRLDLLIVVGAGLSLLLCLIDGCFDKNATVLVVWLNQNSVKGYVAAILANAILLIWMCCGGKRSRLWNWLPPFWFFRKFPPWFRWVLVLGLIGGTLTGMLARAFDF